jgi:hypothetical protein
MGVDSFIFDEVSKTCFYFDRKYNFILGSDDARHDDIVDRMDGTERGRATSEEVMYACDSNIAYWKNEGDESDKHRIAWNESIKRFAQERPNGSFFTASDHDCPDSHDIRRRDKYKEVCFECPKCGGPIEDYHNSGFNATALAKQETCYVWDNFTYTCNHKFPPVKPETTKERASRQAAIQDLVRALEAGGYKPGAVK